MAKSTTEITFRWKSLQDLQRSGELNEKRLVVFLALRTEEFVVEAFSSYWLNSQQNGLYWVEIDSDINHYEYKYDETELEKIARNLLDSKESTDHEKLNARIAISLIAFKHEVFTDNPDPWKLAAHASGLATIVPTPKQRRGLDSKNAQVRGKRGGSQPKRNQALQEVINCVVRDINDKGDKPSASVVWRVLESFGSYSTHHTGVEDCDDLYVDGEKLFWTDFIQEKASKSIKKRSLDPYIAEAKKKLSNPP